METQTTLKYKNWKNYKHLSVFRIAWKLEIVKTSKYLHKWTNESLILFKTPEYNEMRNYWKMKKSGFFWNSNRIF
jgi:hypothetical protein